jgi:hypothetical protein
VSEGIANPIPDYLLVYIASIKIYPVCDSIIAEGMFQSKIDKPDTICIAGIIL